MSEKILDFYEFIYDRQAVAIAKKAGKPRPWSKDPVLNNYRFCNVRRRDDASTKHLVKKLLERPNLSPETVLLNIILFRFFNTRNFYDEVLTRIPRTDNFDVKAIIASMDAAVERGIKLFSTAYMICGIPCVEYRKTDKHVQCVYRVRNMLKDRKFYTLVAENNAQRFYEKVQFDGQYLIGKFLAYQIMLDWSYYTKMEGLSSFVDVGPGAVQGVHFIFGKDKDLVEGCMELFKEQINWFGKLKHQRGKDWGDLDGRTIALSDIENCLCEFRKYHKLKNGIKTRIRRYHAV